MCACIVGILPRWIMSDETPLTINELASTAGEMFAEKAGQTHLDMCIAGNDCKDVRESCELQSRRRVILGWRRQLLSANLRVSVGRLARLPR